ncbi:PLDc N-terminal domain-containing protein [Candidatus Pacearchaeota archaeon]|jgi:CDP-diglyceride synthetase|nr:PLDc N-terminal domain-containing protein [Candidatus Pacearchaeota archaeon]
MVWFGSLMGLVALVAAIWVIYEVVKNKKLNSTEKLIWIVCAILFSIITAIVYFFIGKKK